MRIKLTTVLVGDQQEALDLYTGVLGFENKHGMGAWHPNGPTPARPSEPAARSLPMSSKKARSTGNFLALPPM